MATRPIVPRANGEGSLGVDGANPKYWGAVYTEQLNGAEAQAMADRSVATLRTKNTAYVSGTKVVAGGLPINYMLMCTGSGTTANADITLPATIIDGVTFTDGTVTWQIQELVTTQIFAFRQPSTAVTAASIVFCPGLPSGFYLECKTAGTTGSGAITLPATIVENAEVTDGTVTWTIRKIGSGGGEAVGVIKAFAGNGDLPSGYLLCDGSAVSRTMFPDLFSAIGTTYGSGDGSTTFNVPDYNTAQRFCQGSTVAGTAKSAGLPNIEGTLVPTITVSNTVEATGISGTGAFYNDNPATNRKIFTTTSGSGNLNTIVVLDASRSNPIYGNSDTVQPPALTCRYIIKAFDGQTPDSALIDITQYAQELAGKANITGSNLVHHRDVITTSGTYTAPVAGLYKITVKGGGGGGAGSAYSSSSSIVRAGNGGGEGGTTIAIVRMKIGDTVAVVVGAGGAGGAKNTSSAGINVGSAGGNSSVIINDNSYIAGGGSGNGHGGTGTIPGSCGSLGEGYGNGPFAVYGGTGGGTGGAIQEQNGTNGGGGGGGGAQYSTASTNAGGAGGNGYVWFEYTSSV